MNDPSLIELIHLDVVHEDAPSQVLVRGVNWRIERGDFWIVGGDPSSGKTSLLATAAGLNRPAAGTLRIFGRDLADATEPEQVEWRRHIGFVFEGGGRLFSHLTVAANIALPLQYHLGHDDDSVMARVEELLDWAQAKVYARFMPSRLNQAVQQRVALARALAVPTRVLYLDNPLGGLSLRERRWWLDALRGLQTKQKSAGEPLTIVATGNDFRGWLGLADRFAVIRDRSLHVVGGREDIEKSAEPAVREMIAMDY